MLTLPLVWKIGFTPATVMIRAILEKYKEGLKGMEKEP